MNLIGAWYLAVPGFGWTVINGVRVFIIAQMAPVEAREAFEKVVYGDKKPEERAAFGICCCIFTVLGWLWWLITLPVRLLWRCLRCCISCCHTRCSCCCNCSGLLYCFDYTWRTFLFIPKESVEMGLDVLVTIHLVKKR